MRVDNFSLSLGLIMDLLFVSICIGAVISLYFKNNPLKHSRKFMFYRFLNWFPLGMTYAFLYMGRYNLSVAKNAFGDLMTKESFGIIFGVGTIVYGLSFLLNGPLVDKFGGKKGMLVAAIGSALANIMMGVLTYTYLHGQINVNLTLAFAILYGFNMFCQSYGAVSIIKIKAYWFHVRERGIFGAIFGTLISFGAYFAFDWGQAIVRATQHDLVNPTAAQMFFRKIFAVETHTTNATWLVFFIPALILIVFAFIDIFLIKDTPSQANFEDFDTHDASSNEMDKEFTIKELLARVFKSPLMMTIAAIEFTSGILRNGIMQWYFIFAKEVPAMNDIFFTRNWGISIAISGMLGGFAAGYLSDKIFQSRRAPPAVIMNVVMLGLLMTMLVTLFSWPMMVGLCAVLMCFAVIGVHSLMSGTAAADFGGRKATATASGIVDGFVYLGSGVQSFAIGFLVEKDWSYWPLFLIPFAVLGFFLSLKIWWAIPDATRKYLVEIEKTVIKVKAQKPPKI